MPIYEYRCTACQAEHEVIVIPPEQSPQTCPDCDGKLQRRYSRVGAQFLGWGFTRNDALVADRPGRGDFKTIRDKASELFD